MAHYAKVESGTVTQVIVAEQDFIDTLPDKDKWVQTSYNNNFRKQYAGIGYIYDPVKDKFLTQQPHASWSLNDNDDWQAPITYPTVIEEGDVRYFISWNETKYQADNTKGWKGKKDNLDGTDHADVAKTYDWNGSAWVEA